LFGVTQDVTTYKRAEAQLGNSLTKERELGELKSRFVAMASHEFRTPLTSILSSTDLIELHAEKMDITKFSRHTKRIKSSVDNLTAILNDFLSLEKLETGNVLYTPTALEIPDFFREVIEGIHLSQADRQRISITHRGAATVKLDAQLTRNILINLLSNAVKYAPGDGLITLASNFADRLLTIEVTDQGIGIPAADQRNMFNRFFRASNAESIKGTGLGLNIVKRYLDIMGGSIDFESEEGEGTTFRLRIPQEG
jgi:signal transduction histidine kinase